MGLNKKAQPTAEPMQEARWEECRKCKPFWPYAPNQEKGLVYIEQGRDGRDVHPSQIHKCLKVLYYACAGYAGYAEEKVDPRLRMIFDLGSGWHEVMQRYGKRGAWNDPKHYFPETKIDPDALTFDGKPVLPLAERYWIRGSADALLEQYLITVPGIGDASIRLVHEYKTINSNQYSKLTRPKPEHKYQATMYSAVFNVPIVVYMYTNKDNCQMADFPVAFDNGIWNEITQKIDRVQYFVENEIVPPWEETSATLQPSECHECGFLRICSPPVQLGRRYA
jgi:CRISPR/Cas system-associated exonuclease Cas4 (RecB family)